MAIKTKHIFTVFILTICHICSGQFGGWKSFSFLNIPSDGYTTSLGGILVAPISNDPGLYLNNPALMDSIKKQYIKINYAPLWAGTNTSTVSYGRHFEKTGNFSASLQYLDYGTFVGADAAGNISNNFKANDFVFTVAHAKKANNITLGANLKLAGSTIEMYSAYALLADFGGYFKHPKKELSFGLAIKNMGVRLNNYTNSDNPDLPFDIQIGTTFRPEQMPLRFSINAHHLHRWNIAFDKPIDEDKFQNSNNNEIKFAEKLARHFTFGVEGFIHKNFQLNAGYNHLLRKELKLETFTTLSGFSFGFLIKTKKLNVSFGHQSFQSAGGLNQFSTYIPLK